jgi:hypothetical protein
VIVAATLCNQATTPCVALVVVDLASDDVRLVEIEIDSPYSGATGLTSTQDGGLVVCLQGTNDIVRFDQRLDVVWRIQVPEIVDVHSCADDGDVLWVASTGSDSVVGLRIAGTGLELAKVLACAEGRSDTLHVNSIAVCGDDLLMSYFGPGWRSRPKNTPSGAIVGLWSGKVLADGVAQPHSVVSHDGRIFVLGSYDGTIEEIAHGRRTCRAQFPGYLRGLAIGPWGAVVGVSGQRRRSRGLGTENADRPNFEDRCLIVHFDPAWELVKTVDLSWLGREIYDIVALPSSFDPPSPGETISAAKRRIELLENSLEDALRTSAEHNPVPSPWHRIP